MLGPDATARRSSGNRVVDPAAFPRSVSTAAEIAWAIVVQDLSEVVQDR
jgi:hypothetical protein